MNNQLCLFYIEGVGYDFDGIKVTIKSLREYYKGKAIALCKDVDKQLLVFLTKNDIECIDCSAYKVLFKTSPYNNKVLYSYLFLKQNLEQYKQYNVLLCDIGDVYFKTNPFCLCSEHSMPLTLFLEDKPFINCECNSTWIRVCYNQHVLEKIKNNIVINAGLYLSSYLRLLEFFKLMVDEMSLIFGKVNYPIVEQAVVNKLIYVNKVECVLDSENVNNMAQQVKTKADNKINHQYKVFPELKKEIYNIYAE